MIQENMLTEDDFHQSLEPETIYILKKKKKKQLGRKA